MSTFRPKQENKKRKLGGAILPFFLGEFMAEYPVNRENIRLPAVFRAPIPRAASHRVFLKNGRIRRTAIPGKRHLKLIVCSGK